jgi:sulfhydrogenase subunit gamma (sulfur reductase)
MHKPKENPYLPFNAMIVGIDDLNEESKNFKLDSPELREMTYSPGQFIQVTVYGVGEIAIGITDTMYDDGFEVAIRNTGGLVTSYLHQMEVGDILGVRGPLGKPFQMNDFKNKNLLFICAGIGFWPIRSCIKYVLHHRQDYGELMAVFGVRNSHLFTYTEDVDSWMSREDMKIQRTVDSCSDEDCWDENVGLITSLTDKFKPNRPDNWVVLCCGPPVAFKFIGQSLNKNGFHDDQIWVSLERKMKCGIGKCNHCLINGTRYVCMDGPVFTLGEAKSMPGGLD